MLVIYCLFLYDASREDAWEALDDVIYYTRAVVRCMEFLVALFVVCAGFHESFVGQWSWSNSAVLVVHCYFNVWQRLQTGWVSYLRRREAAKHVRRNKVIFLIEFNFNFNLLICCRLTLCLRRVKSNLLLITTFVPFVTKP